MTRQRDRSSWGHFHQPSKIYPPEADAAVIEHDRLARGTLVLEFAEIFLAPERIGFTAIPPTCTPSSQALPAGFCAVCDWIGSNIDAFPYRKLDADIPVADYFAARVRDIEGTRLLRSFGLVADPGPYGGVARLLGEGESPRGVQVLVDAGCCW